MVFHGSRNHVERDKLGRYTPFAVECLTRTGRLSPADALSDFHYRRFVSTPNLSMLCAFVPFVLSGCFQDAGDAVGGTTDDSDGDGGASADTGTDAGAGTGSDAGTHADTGVDTGGEGDAVCGNGVVEMDEECDDGNKDDSDSCTSLCAVPSCEDAVQNGDETDVDCGGSCEGCEPAGICDDDSDCVSANCYVGECMEACVPWAQQFGTSSGDAIYDAAIDPLGNIVVAGESAGTFPGASNSGGDDAFVARIGADGTLDFVRQTGGPSEDLALGIAVRGELLVITGRTEGAYDGNAALGSTDGFLTAYDDNTTKLASQPVGTAAYDTLSQVGLDANEKLLLVGNTNGDFAPTGHPDSDLLIVKTHSDGAQIWAHQLGGPAVDYGRSVAIDGDNNVIVVGDSDGAFEGNAALGDFDVTLAKLDPDGMLDWSLQLGGAALDRPGDVATDEAGDIYVVGHTASDFEGAPALGELDAFITKVSAAGEVLWTTQFGTGADDIAQAIVLDAEGTVYVAGGTAGDFGGALAQGENDMFIAAFDSAGAMMWSEQLGTSGEDVGRGLAIGPEGQLYLAGYSAGPLGGSSLGGYDGYIARVCTR